MNFVTESLPFSREPNESTFVMVYAHLGGFCFNGTTAANEKCLPVANLSKME